MSSFQQCMMIINDDDDNNNDNNNGNNNNEIIIIFIKNSEYLQMDIEIKQIVLYVQKCILTPKELA